MKLFMFLTLIIVTNCNIFIQNPPGSNNRNREKSTYRYNRKRLFNSQNTAKGGYPWRGSPVVDPIGPDPITYYTGSFLRLEWTNQNGCGPNNNLHCEMVVQAACEDTLPALRDGYPSGDFKDMDDENPGMYYERVFQYNDEMGKKIIPLPTENPITSEFFPSQSGDPQFEDHLNDFYKGTLLSEAGLIGVEFGMHEPYENYIECQKTERNFGLLHLDQELEGDSARYTRQNKEGGRYGFECPEERDYYPYWRPSLWKDIAVFPNKNEWCDYYQSHSQNVKSRFYCECDDKCFRKTSTKKIPIAQDTCETAGGTWRENPSWGIDPPDCITHPYTADNHLGMAYKMDSNDNPILEDGPPQNAYYDWKIPEWMAGENNENGQLCVLRFRYNVSSLDFNPQPYLSSDGTFLDSNYDCSSDSHSSGGTHDSRPFCSNSRTVDTVPLYNRPYIRIWDDLPEISIAFNTEQIGRTFQDRTYVFRIASRPKNIPDDATIWNLNTRGKRGALATMFPSSEYIYVPDPLEVNQGDWISVNLHGTAFNANDNNGEGWNYADKHNIVQVDKGASLFPSSKDNINLFNEEIARDLAMPPFEKPPLGEYKNCDLSCCVDFLNKTENENDYSNSIINCAKLNHAPYLLRKDFKVEAGPGKYFYIGTRNSNFTSRIHRSYIIVKELLSNRFMNMKTSHLMFCLFGLFLFTVRTIRNKRGKTSVAVESV